MHDSTHDKATLISADLDNLTTFVAEHGFPLIVAMTFAPQPSATPTDAKPACEQHIDGFLAKNRSLYPWLGENNVVTSREVFDQVVAKILAPPYASPVILVKRWIH